MIRRDVPATLSLIIILLASQGAFSGTTPIESLVPRIAPDGWALRDAPKTLTRETLFEHIDGQADLFLQYGYEKSVFAIYQDANSSESRIDVDLYDMGTPLQAFGVYSRFRQEDSPAGIGLDSYLEDRYALFYKGKYFVVLQAVDSNRSTLKRLAQDIESLISDDASPAKEIGHFPKSGLKPGSIQYFPDGLLGHRFLKRGFKASYVQEEDAETGAHTSEDRDFHLFLSIFENSQEAADALGLFREHLLKKGKVAEGIPTPFGPGALIGVDPYQGKTIVVHRGPYLVGAVGFRQDGYGQQRLAELMKEVK